MNKKIMACFAAMVLGASVLYGAEGKLLTPKKATASSVQEDANEDGTLKFEAKYAIDGNRETRWSSKFEDNQWLEVDMGKLVTIDKFVLLWETACAKSYKLEVSVNKKKWQSIYSNENCPGGEDVVPLKKPVKTRYVRMSGLTRATEWGFSIFEFEVYGK